MVARDFVESKFFQNRSLNKVFESLGDLPKSALQISDDSNLSLPTVYRKLKKLEEKHLVLKSGKLQNGVKNTLYKKKESLKQ